VPVEIGLNPLHTADGVFVISSIVDLSRQREIDRLRSEFLSTVSHELRTPLTSICGALGLLQSGAAGVLPEKASAMARIAYKNSERLVRIINDILDIGKLEAGQVAFQCTAVRLSELLQQSIEANATYADKYGVRLELEDGSNGELAFVDPNRIIQVLTNLLSNACKFSPRGAVVRVRARPHAAMLRVEIEDSGPGIPPEFQSRIFQKFSQADASTTRRFEGTGLGLSIARKLIEGMGGLIGFSTVIDQGTVFYFEVPTGEPPVGSNDP
jgi:signal transduction histidine kinase